MSLAILNRIGSLFWAFSLPRIKNNKTLRDIQAKWVKDNYSLQIKLMFQAALADAKVLFQFPDELMNELLDDKDNRNEVFRWIVEGVNVENFDIEKLNLLPYMERYPRFQEMLEAFFITILNKIHEYKDTHWNAEFLQILARINSIETEIREGFIRIDASQKDLVLKLEENNTLIKSFFEPVSFDDLNELVKLGDVKIARERALARLQGKNPLTSNELMELNAVIASSFFLNAQEKEAIPYLHVAIANCQNEARKNRLNALISIFQDENEVALAQVHLAIENEGYSQRNLEILINIFIKQGEPQSALELIQEYPALDLKELHAYVLISDKQFDKALLLAESVLTEKQNDFTWLLIKAEVLTLSLEHQILHGEIVNPEDVYQQTIEILNKLEIAQKQNDRITMRLKELRAGISFRNRKFTEAKLNFEWLYLHNQDNEEFHYNHLLFSCLCDQDWDKAIELLIGKIDKGNYNIDDIITLGRVYVDSGEPENAKRLLEGKISLVERSSLSSLVFYFVYIDCLMMCLHISEIEQLIKKLQVENYFDTGIHALRAYSSTLNHNWDVAVEEWEACINQLSNELFAEAAMRLSIAYMNRGSKQDLKKMTDLIVRIPYWMYHESLLNRYIRGLYDLGEYEKIISLSKETPTNSDMLFEVVTTIYFNFEWYDLAKGNYMALYQKTHEIIYLCRYASCLFRLGETKECLDILSSIEKRILEKPSIEYYHLMSVTFANAMNFAKALEYAYKAYLLGKENPQVCRFYFLQFLQLAQHVNSPLPEWIHAYESVGASFASQFPEEKPLFIAVKALNDDNSIADEFLNMLKAQTDSREETTLMLKTQKFPPSFMAAFLHKGPYETWMHYAQNSDLDFWIQIDEQELDKGISTAENSKSVLCDPYVLLTIRQLNLLDELKHTFKLYIHQEDFNELHQEYLKKKVISEKGLKTIAYENGKIVHTENPAEQVRRYVKQHEEFIEWINENCEKIGNKVIDSDFTDTNDKLDFLIHPIDACKDQNLDMFVDSYIVRIVAQKYNVKTFNTYELITALRANDNISQESYLNSFGELILLGYALLPINEKLVTHWLQQNYFIINDKINHLFLYLRRDELDHNYVMIECSKILKWVWLDSIPTFQREIITDTICNVVTYQKNKSLIISQLLSITKPLFSVLVQHQFNKLSVAINKWLQGQIF